MCGGGKEGRREGGKEGGKGGGIWEGWMNALSIHI